MIHFLHPQTDELLGYLDPSSKENYFDAYSQEIIGGNNKIYWDDNQDEEVGGANVLNFKMRSDIPEAEFTEERGRFVAPHSRGGWQECIIEESVTRGKYKQITAIGTIIELNVLKTVYPQKHQSRTLKEYLAYAVDGETWHVGNVEFEGSKSLTFDEFLGGYDFAKRLEAPFEVEVTERIETQGIKVQRYLEAYQRVGAFRGKEVVAGVDLVNIERKVHNDRIVTALLCVGPEREDGTRLGPILVTDSDAQKRWGRMVGGELKHIVRVYTPETDDQEMTEERLRQLGKMELDKRISSVVEFTVEVADTGEEMFIGDTIRLKDPEFVPPLYAEARILKIQGPIPKLDEDRVLNRRYTIGEVVEYDEEDILKTFRELQRKYALRVIRSETKPPGDVNRIWVQIIPNLKVEVPHIYDTTIADWIPISPVAPGDIGAEPVIPEGPNPPNPVFSKKWVDTSGEIPELKMWDGATWTAVKGPKGEDGYTPVKGTDYFDGKDGQDGSDGTSAFIWVRYSQNEDGSGMVDDPTGAKYIGVSTTEIASAPLSPTAYQWSLIKGSDGVPGEPGDDGRTSYLHIKYSNDGGSTFTTNSGETVGEWIGTYVDFTQADSASPAAYTWNKVKGERGEPGEDGYTPVKGVDYFDGVDGQDGISSYMWVKYSQYADGSFMTDDPTDARYIGVATTQTVSAPSEKSAYQWTLIRGSDGIPGEPGADGSSSFLHIKYSNDGGSTFTANNGETAGEYIGQYVDFTQQDSSNPADYTWNRVKGEQGEQGPNIVDSTTQIEANVVKANHIDVSNLSAIKANLGEVTAGIFRNATSSNVINMDTGVINFGNGKFVVDDGDVTFSGSLSGASGTFSGEVNVGGLNDLGEGQQTLISGGRFHQETANNELEIDAHGIRIHSLNSTADERYTFWNNSGMAFNSVEAGVQHGVNYGANLVNGITYGRIYSDNEFTIDTDDIITFDTNGGTDTFQFSNVESFRHALMKFGKGALKSLNGSVAGVQVRNSADTAFIPISASNIEVASDRKFKKNIEKFEGTALWDVLNTPVHAYHLREQIDNEPKVIGLLADEAPEVMRIRDDNGDRVSLYAQNNLLWRAMQELFDLLVDTKAVNLNKVKKKG